MELSPEEVEKIKTIYRYRSPKDLAEKYGVSTLFIQALWGKYTFKERPYKVPENTKVDIVDCISHEQHMADKAADKAYKKKKLAKDGSEYLPRLNNRFNGSSRV